MTCEIFTDGLPDGFTVTTTLFEVAVVGLAQLKLLVSTQLIVNVLAPPTNKVELLDPVLLPLNFHW
jgi:hypothetical protein